MFELVGKYAKAIVMIDDVEAECISQIMEFLNHSMYEGCTIRIMPDTHGGKGSVIGFTCTMNGKGVCANTIGVDISCGVNVWKITPNVTDFAALDVEIRKVLPLGPRGHERAVVTMKKDFDYSKVELDVYRFVKKYNEKFGTYFEAPVINYKYYLDLCNKLKFSGQAMDEFLGRVNKSCGSLGGGNHYIEIDIDENGQQYLTIHSGSRNFGKRVAEYFQKIAEGQSHNAIGNRDLAYLVGQDTIDYLVAMVFVHEFASMNRKIMGELIAKAGGFELSDPIETVHNFIDHRDFTIRKGAIRSYVGERMIIPFNMAVGSWICEGKSNAEWNNSGPHGAGRIMSRGQAKRTLKLEDFQNQMNEAGVFSTSICAETLDEAPGSYKDASTIQAAIEPTAKILHVLKPVYNLKSAEDIKRKKGKVTNNE